MRKIRLFYWAGFKNFGDELSIYIAQKLHGNVERSSKWLCNAIFVGSMLNLVMTRSAFIYRAFWLLLPPVKVWGGGYVEFVERRRNVKLFRRLDVRACRGVHTLERLRQERAAKIADNVVLADSGLLVSRLIDAAHVKKKYELGIIPHVHDKHSTLLSNIKVKSTIVIDIQQSPEAFIEQLLECKNIISSALHGLVAADAYGIPNIRMILSDKIEGGDVKYNDYYSAFGLDSHKYIDLTKREFAESDLPDIKESYIIKPEQVKQLQEKLLAVFPF